MNEFFCHPENIPITRNVCSDISAFAFHSAKWIHVLKKVLNK
jgi:hypothetical protein